LAASTVPEKPPPMIAIVAEPGCMITAVNLEECSENTTTAPGSQARLVRTVNLTTPETFLRRAGDKQRGGICCYPANLSVRGDGFQGRRGGRNMRD
jgi:hypothetical protein